MHSTIPGVPEISTDNMAQPATITLKLLKLFLMEEVD
jgi:hypothetical protein